jgi:hypothetical protein
MPLVWEEEFGFIHPFVGLKTTPVRISRQLIVFCDIEIFRIAADAHSKPRIHTTAFFAAAQDKLLVAAVAANYDFHASNYHATPPLFNRNHHPVWTEKLRFNLFLAFEQSEWRDGVRAIHPPNAAEP